MTDSVDSSTRPPRRYGSGPGAAGSAAETGQGEALRVLQNLSDPTAERNKGGCTAEHAGAQEGRAETPRERRALGKVDVVHTQCTRLENLLNDFLKFTRLQELNLLAGNLNEVLGRVCDLFAVQALDADVEIRRYLDPDLPSILIDAETLEAAIVNLVKNAMESMPDGGTLTVTTRLTKNAVAVDLIDTGCGMGERTALHMFDAFFFLRFVI